MRMDPQQQQQGHLDTVDQQVMVGQIMADDIRKGATVHVSRTLVIQFHFRSIWQTIET